MNVPYRLAVVGIGGSDVVVVEKGGRLLPLDTLLEGEIAPPRASDLLPVIVGWERWSELLRSRVEDRGRQFEVEGVEAASATFRSPIATPGKIICIGANYTDHVEEMKAPVTPTYPYSFIKPANNTLRGSGESVVAPRGVQMFDWEAELAVVMGVRTRDVAAAQALDCVAGYANFNDLSARDWIASRPGIGVDWILHKAFDGFAPIGPYFVPAEFIATPQDLPIKLCVNGVLKQDSSTARMVFGIAEIIEHLSSFMTLESGDIIAAGTPAGVGHGRNPQEFLKPGDVVQVEIGPLGRLVTPIVA